MEYNYRTSNIFIQSTYTWKKAYSRKRSLILMNVTEIDVVLGEHREAFEAHNNQIVVECFYVFYFIFFFVHSLFPYQVECRWSAVINMTGRFFFLFKILLLLLLLFGWCVVPLRGCVIVCILREWNENKTVNEIFT